MSTVTLTIDGTKVEAEEGMTLLEMDGSKILYMSDFFKDTEKF